ncbi:18829_t:CDS:2 [Racocetra persica]|uniref:18829_t:CDS:1 n=1 Tax=Racocetra persica TaxID=160502 RepID=A0ACA9KE27_9GLOM|nr:18829_t:CDS:2 [Racocetra persica]
MNDDESALKDSIYNIFLYVALEVLNKWLYIITADIYILCIIITKMSTRKPQYGESMYRSNRPTVFYSTKIIG